MPSNVVVRQILSADLDQAALMEEMWRLHGQKARLIDPAKVTAITGRSYIERFLSQYDGTVLIAELNQQIVGVMTAQIQVLPAYYRQDKELYLDDLCVAKQVREHGIASQLLEAAADYAKEKSISLLTGKIWAFNDASRALFKSQGFSMDYEFWHKPTLDK